MPYFFSSKTESTESTTTPRTYGVEAREGKSPDNNVVEAREGKSSDNEVMEATESKFSDKVEAREGKSIEKDYEILETTRVASKEAELIDKDGDTEVREGKSLEEDNEVVEASAEESREEDAVEVENIEVAVAREGKSIDDEDNMLIEAKQAHQDQFDLPMDGIFNSLSLPKLGGMEIYILMEIYTKIKRNMGNKAVMDEQMPQYYAHF